MKKWFTLMLAVACLISMCGCNSKNKEQIASPDEFVEQDTVKTQTEEQVNNPEKLTPEDQPSIHFESVEKTETDTVTYYYDQDISGLTASGDPLSEYVDPPETYSELMHRIGEDGLIVAGVAVGLREGRRSAVKTITEFEVQKVCFGTSSQEKIKICEDFVIVRDEERNHINYKGNKYTRLKDQQPVLLFLTPSEWLDGAYEPVYYEIPLPKDFSDYSEDYLNQFLDYYRGDRSAYQYPEQYVETVEIEQPDGTILEVFREHGGNYWAEQDVSNEILLENMKEHILVRTVAEYQIKVWPADHAQYESPLDGVSETGIHKVSYPK